MYWALLAEGPTTTANAERRSRHYRHHPCTGWRNGGASDPVAEKTPRPAKSHRRGRSNRPEATLGDGMSESAEGAATREADPAKPLPTEARSILPAGRARMMPALTEMLLTIGWHLVATCPRHKRQPDPERPWLRRQSSDPCSVWRALQAALGLEPPLASAETFV